MDAPKTTNTYPMGRGSKFGSEVVDTSCMYLKCLRPFSAHGLWIRGEFFPRGCLWWPTGAFAYSGAEGWFYGEFTQNWTERSVQNYKHGAKRMRKWGKRSPKQIACGTEADKWRNRGVPSRVCWEPFWFKINKKWNRKVIEASVAKEHGK